MGHEVAGRTPPSPDKTKTRTPRPDRSLEALRALNVDSLNVSTEPVTENDEDAFKKAITVEEIKLLRASIFEAEQSLSGETPLACDMLGNPPKPSDIIDVFSSILGDIFHTMDRCTASPCSISPPKRHNPPKPAPPREAWRKTPPLYVCCQGEHHIVGLTAGT